MQSVKWVVKVGTGKVEGAPPAGGAGGGGRGARGQAGSCPADTKSLEGPLALGAPPSGVPVLRSLSTPHVLNIRKR